MKAPTTTSRNTPAMMRNPRCARTRGGLRDIGHMHGLVKRYRFGIVFVVTGGNAERQCDESVGLANRAVREGTIRDVRGEQGGAAVRGGRGRRRLLRRIDRV